MSVKVLRILESLTILLGFMFVFGLSLIYWIDIMGDLSSWRRYIGGEGNHNNNPVSLVPDVEPAATLLVTCIHFAVCDIFRRIGIACQQLAIISSENLRGQVLPFALTIRLARE